MHEVIRLGLIDSEFIAHRTSNYDALAETVADYPPERAAQITGVDADTIREVARTWGEAGAGVVFWGMGISQHTTGTDNARCLIALCSITGNVGRPGTGLHPLRGQNNVQGASDTGLIPMFYPDYQGGRPRGPGRFEQAWGTADLDPKRGLTVTEIISSVLKDGVRGMYMLGENPFLSDPNINKVRKALSALDFLVRPGHLPDRDRRVRRRDPARPRRTWRRTAPTPTPTAGCSSAARCSTRPARPGWTGRSCRTSPTGSGSTGTTRAPREVFDEMVALMPQLREPAATTTWG